MMFIWYACIMFKQMLCALIIFGSIQDLCSLFPVATVSVHHNPLFPHISCDVIHLSHCQQENMCMINLLFVEYYELWVFSLQFWLCQPKPIQYGPSCTPESRASRPLEQYCFSSISDPPLQNYLSWVLSCKGHSLGSTLKCPAVLGASPTPQPTRCAHSSLRAGCRVWAGILCLICPRFSFIVFCHPMCCFGFFSSCLWLAHVSEGWKNSFGKIMDEALFLITLSLCHSWARNATPESCCS